MQMIIIPILFIVIMGYSVGKEHLAVDDLEKFKSAFNCVITIGIILYIIGGFLW